jgi:hypothetical protein
MMDFYPPPLVHSTGYSIGWRDTYSTPAGEYYDFRKRLSPTWHHSTVPHLQSYNSIRSLWYVSHSHLYVLFKLIRAQGSMHRFSRFQHI